MQNEAAFMSAVDKRTSPKILRQKCHYCGHLLATHTDRDCFDLLAARVRELEAAIDKAMRETASDPDNGWCRNATIILSAALKPRSARET